MKLSSLKRTNKSKNEVKGFNYVGQQLLIIVLIVLGGFLLFLLGLMVGYGVIGDGDSVWSILSWDKWQDLIGKFTGN